MPVQAVLVSIISLTSIACMLARPRAIAEAYWVCGGASLLVVTRLLPLADAGRAVRRGLDVYLFLTGMMMLAELARKEGVFEWLAGIAGRCADGSPSRLFLYVYLAGTVVTALLSNDATAVVLTPAVLAVVRKAKVEPKPYLLACALIANAASFLFPISNPANLVVFANDMPRLSNWLGTFFLPSIASIVITFLVLRFNFDAEFKASVENLGPPPGLSPQGKLAVFGLALACLALISASALGLRLGTPTCAAAIFATLLIGKRDRSAPVAVARKVSWSVIPLVAGLFVIVQGLENAGLVPLALIGLRALARAPRVIADLAAGFSVALLSNGMNNLPAGLIASSVIHAYRQPGSLAAAVLIGVDLGPNLSVTGSLATILWLIALRREGVHITGWQFLKIGAVAMPLALLGSIVLLRP